MVTCGYIANENNQRPEDCENAGERDEAGDMEGEKLDKERKTERELWKSWRRGKMMKKNRRKKEMGIEWVTVGIVGSVQVGGMEGEKETEKR